MKFVKIASDVIINPEMISAVEVLVVNDRRTLVITMSDGKQRVAEVDPTTLLQDLVKAGMESDGKVWQFWAG